MLYDAAITPERSLLSASHFCKQFTVLRKKTKQKLSDVQILALWCIYVAEEIATFV